MARLPNINKAKQAAASSYFDQDESDVDDDGNPLTVSAALRLFHQDEGTRTVYCPKQTYENPFDSLAQLNKKKAHIQELLQKARVDQLQKTGNTMGEVIKSDMKVTHMPIVRVLQRSTKAKQPPAPQPPMAQQRGADGDGADREAQFRKKKTSTLTVTQPEKSRLNYQALTSKAQKSLAQQNNQPVDPRTFLPGGLSTFEPPQAHHKFQKEDTALRAMYKHIVRDKRHSTFNQSGGDEVAQYNMDSMVDISDAASHRFKNVDSRLGPSRQGHTLNYSGKKSAAGLAGLDDEEEYYPRRGQLPLSPGGPFQHRNASMAPDSLHSRPGAYTGKKLAKTLVASHNIHSKYVVPNAMARQVYPAKMQARAGFASKSIGLSPQKNTLAIAGLKSNLSSAGASAAGYLPPPSRYYGTSPILVQNESKEEFNQTVMQINARKLKKARAQPHVRMVDPGSDDEDDGPELFIAQPTDDIPRNKLVEKLARGLQAYVQRMQKRESFFVTVIKKELHNWQPAPRECATITAINGRGYLVGGLNFDANREVAELRLAGLQSMDVDDVGPDWGNLDYHCTDQIQGRCRHTSCGYNDKVYTFGGCFKFNSKRQVRECTNQILVYDTIEGRYSILKTKGINILPRKDHHAAIFGQSMLVYGGQFENGQFTNEMLNFDLEYNDWSRIYYKQNIDPFVQGACCSVMLSRKQSTMPGSEMTRLSDAVLDGIYFFGGKNQKGELQTKLKYLKPHCIDGKVMSVEWQKIKQGGVPPCGRVGHAISFLQANQALLVVGGRNDEVCKSLSTPFLNDIHLFLLDQKAWVSVKYTPFSQRLYRLGNHAMCTMTDGESYEKTVIFGGITHSMIGTSPAVKSAKGAALDKGAAKGKGLKSPEGFTQIKSKFESEMTLTGGDEASHVETSHLSNDLYVLEVRQIM